MTTKREQYRRGQIRVYPTECTSAYCGRTECPADCRNLPTLREFNAWREATGAVREDETWCPRIWTAQHDEGKA